MASFHQNLFLNLNFLQVEEADASNPDLVIHMELGTLRQILSAERNALDLLEEGVIQIDNDRQLLSDFFDCFELGDNIEYKKYTLSRL